MVSSLPAAGPVRALSLTDEEFDALTEDERRIILSAQVVEARVRERQASRQQETLAAEGADAEEAKRHELESLRQESLAEEKALEEARRLQDKALQEAKRLEALRLEDAAAEEAKRQELERLEQERLAEEQALQEAKRLEALRLERERLAAEQAAAEEAKKQELERLEQERLAEEQALQEAKRLEALRLERERLAAKQAAAEEAKRQELERLEQERAAQQRQGQLQRQGIDMSAEVDFLEGIRRNQLIFARQTIAAVKEWEGRHQDFHYAETQADPSQEAAVSERKILILRALLTAKASGTLSVDEGVQVDEALERTQADLRARGQNPEHLFIEWHEDELSRARKLRDAKAARDRAFAQSAHVDDRVALKRRHAENQAASAAAPALGQAGSKRACPDMNKDVDARGGDSMQKESKRRMEELAAEEQSTKEKIRKIREERLRIQQGGAPSERGQQPAVSETRKLLEQKAFQQEQKMLEQSASKPQSVSNPETTQEARHSRFLQFFATLHPPHSLSFCQDVDVEDVMHPKSLERLAAIERNFNSATHKKQWNTLYRMVQPNAKGDPKVDKEIYERWHKGP